MALLDWLKGLRDDHQESQGGTEDYLVTRELREISTPAQRRELLDCLFAAAASDEGMTTIEESQIRQMANERGCAHDEYIAARLAWSDQRTILRDVRMR
jgi:uncharacterized tellurite resistance protein B-like protein